MTYNMALETGGVVVGKKVQLAGEGTAADGAAGPDAVTGTSGRVV